MPALLLLLIAVAGVEGEPADETARQEEVAKLAPAKARQVEMLVGNKEEKAVLRKEPLLRWSNPTAGSVYGEVFLWTYGNRPAVIASIYRWYDPYHDSTFEVVSTSPTPVKGREGKQIFWESTGSGVKFEPLAGAPVPAASANQRLNQMRQLARKFSAELIDQRVGGDAVTRDLRLLNQPVYRYECPDENIIDGGLFALVEVTDPEVWILLEAAKHEGKPVWQFALTRMNADACQVRLDDKPIQRWERIIEPWRIHKAPYTLLGFKPESVKLDEKDDEK